MFRDRFYTRLLNYFFHVRHCVIKGRVNNLSRSRNFVSFYCLFSIHSIFIFVKPHFKEIINYEIFSFFAIYMKNILRKFNLYALYFLLGNGHISTMLWSMKKTQVVYMAMAIMREEISPMYVDYSGYIPLFLTSSSVFMN